MYHRQDEGSVEGFLSFLLVLFMLFIVFSVWIWPHLNNWLKGN